MSRIGYANDINPLSGILALPRINPPALEDIKLRLDEIEVDYKKTSDIDLSMFFHKDTLAEIISIRDHCLRNKDKINDWILMVITNRLTGHSSGFLSTYTLPPDQAVTQERQKKINEKYNNVIEYKNTKQIILKKSRILLSKISTQDLQNLVPTQLYGKYTCEDASFNKHIINESVQLTVTSPPLS